MTKLMRPLVLSLLALLSLGATSAQALAGFTWSAVGPTMTQACNAAVQGIEDHCDRHGPVSTDPIRCVNLYDGQGTFLGKVCTCEATTAFCFNVQPPSH